MPRVRYCNEKLCFRPSRGRVQEPDQAVPDYVRFRVSGRRCSPVIWGWSGHAMYI